MWALVLLSMSEFILKCPHIPWSYLFLLWVQVMIETKAKTTKIRPSFLINMNYQVDSNKENTGSIKVINCWFVCQANVDVLALPRVARLRSVFLSHLKAHRAFNPAPQLLLVRAWGPSIFPLPFLIPFHPSCPSAFCSLARTVIKPSACGQGLPPVPPVPPFPAPKSHQQTKLWGKWRAETEGGERGVRDSH